MSSYRLFMVLNSGAYRGEYTYGNCVVKENNFDLYCGARFVEVLLVVKNLKVMMNIAPCQLSKQFYAKQKTSQLYSCMRVVMRKGMQRKFGNKAFFRCNRYVFLFKQTTGALCEQWQWYSAGYFRQVGSGIETFKTIALQTRCPISAHSCI